MPDPEPREEKPAMSQREIYLIVHTLPRSDAPGIAHVYAELWCRPAGLKGRIESAGAGRVEAFVLGPAAEGVPDGLFFVVHPIKWLLLQGLRGIPLEDREYSMAEIHADAGLPVPPHPVPTPSRSRKESRCRTPSPRKADPRGGKPPGRNSGKKQPR